MQRGNPSRTGCGPAGHNRGNNPYGDGAPHGDPFQVPDQAGSTRHLGHGPPPNVHVGNTRSTSLDTPMAVNRFHSSNARAASLNTIPSTNSTYYHPSVNTPTPANRYPAAPWPPVPAQFVIPEQRTQLDQVVDMMQMLLRDNAELKHRMSAIEGVLSNLTTSSSVRGAPAQRGGRTTRSTTRAASTRVSRQLSEGSDNGSIDPSLRGGFASQTTTDASEETDLAPEDMEDDDIVVDVLPAEKNALQKLVTQGFRRFCNVTRGTQWPDPALVRVNPITNQVYKTPFFDFPVTDLRNLEICREVAQEVYQELKDKDNWPAVLKRSPDEPDPTWTVPFLDSLAKESFRSGKKQWKEAHSAEASLKAAVNRCTNRRDKRRIRKMQHLLKILKAFAAEFGLDLDFLKDVVHEAYLSDEVSGPEDGSDETKEAWKVRLAAAAEMSLDPAALKRTRILEILTPAWRSDNYSTLIHAMEQFYSDGTTVADRLNLKYDRVGVGRTSDRVPSYAPYNFGLSQEWFAANRDLPAYRTEFERNKWNNYREPDECGLIFDDEGKLILRAKGGNNGGQVAVDARFDFDSLDEVGDD